MRCAVIVDGSVKNIVRIHPMNAASFPNAVHTGKLPVSIGDTYANGVFYHEGIEITLPDTTKKKNEDE